jgi:hypothetical protein
MSYNQNIKLAYFFLLEVKNKKKALQQVNNTLMSTREKSSR